MSNSITGQTGIKCKINVLQKTLQRFKIKMFILWILEENLAEIGVWALNISVNMLLCTGSKISPMYQSFNIFK